MKSFLGSILILTFSNFAWAFNSDILETCAGILEDGTEVTFEIRKTAVPTYVDAVLVSSSSNELISHLSCQKVGTSQGNNVVAVWECLEYPQAPQAGFKIEISTGGFSGKTGVITLGQMFPLQPQHVGSLVCR